MNGSSIYFAIALGAMGMWLLSPQIRTPRRRRTFGKALAAAGLLLMLWQLPPGGDGAMGVLLLIVSGGLIAAAAATVVAEQLRCAAICFCLAVLAAYGLLMLAGAWATALVVAVLSAVACAAARGLFPPSGQPSIAAGRETASWEPMLASATAAVIVGIMSTPAHNLVIVGLVVFGIGLMGLISRQTGKRLFLSAGIMLIGALSTAFGWSCFAGRFTDGSAAAAIAAAGGVWIAAGFWLVRPRASCGEYPPVESNAVESNTGKQAGHMDARYYALLTALAVVVIIGVLKLGG